MDWLRETAIAVADLALGRCCAGCDQPGGHLCAECATPLHPRVRVHTRLQLDEVAPGVGIPVLAPLEYSGTCRRILYRFKDHGDLSLTSVLARALSAALVAAHSTADTPPLVAIPIPTRRSAARHRGFSPVDRLLRTAIHDPSLSTHPVLSIHDVLVDSRTRSADKALGASDRHAAVAGAFGIRGRVPRGPAVLVDDVVTTGATLREAAITLMHAGVHLVAAVAVAGTPSGRVRGSVGVGR